MLKKPLLTSLVVCSQIQMFLKESPNANAELCNMNSHRDESPCPFQATREVSRLSIRLNENPNHSRSLEPQLRSNETLKNKPTYPRNYFTE